MTEEETPDIDEQHDPRPAHGRPFVPATFVPPSPPRTESLWLEPLGPQHNAADYAAWTSSMEHIHATPGFESRRWPHSMTLAENEDDLLMHADHFVRRVGFTYTVRSSADDDVIGCVYIYPSRDPEQDVDVRSWVRATHAELDVALWATVGTWLIEEWPFRPDRISYAAR